MPTFIPKRMWKAKGPVSVSAKIRQKRSKKVKVVRKSHGVAPKLQVQGERIS